jgi:capsular exopolysaccharide synthesis family protein
MVSVNEVRKNGETYSTLVGNALRPGVPAGATNGGEYIVSLRGLLRVIRQRLWIILVVAVVLVGAVVGFSLVQTPTYEASIKILVGQESGITQDPNYAPGLQQLTLTMVEAMKSRPVAEAVIQQENLRVTPGEFLGNLSVEQVPSTQFIKVVYTDTDPQRAQRAANTLGEVFSRNISEVNQEANAVTATIWEPAVVPDEPASPNLLRNGLLALVLGLVTGVGLAFLAEYLDDSWRSPEEVEQISGVHTYGVIPTIEFSNGKRRDATRVARSRQESGEPHRRREEAQTHNVPAEELDERLVTVLDHDSAVSEAYRTLRTNLIHSWVDTPPKAIVLTSPARGEGKSITCANLGVVLAQAEKKILLVDCDFRKPTLHNFFRLDNLRGVADVLARERRLQEVWREPVEGLMVVSAGAIPPNPSEVLGSRRFSEFLAGVRQEFDYILVDASPMGVVSDPAILATQGDGVLLVLDAQNTRKGSVRQTMRSLETVGANVLGTVMNNVTISKDSYYRGGYT